MSVAEMESEFEKITVECLNRRTHPVPTFVSFLYCAAYLLFAGMTVWGTVSTAWWVLLLGLLGAVLIHIPFRESMAGLNQIQRLEKLGALAGHANEEE